ncbi:MAG: methylated-DNA--[protein]-cysteine S-methyltransferase [Desulfurivibrionaceae bacterium]
MPLDTTICFYTISRNERTIHLSFDRQKHIEALRDAKNLFSSRELKTDSKEFSEKALKKLLAENIKETPLPTNNPFIERATPFQRRVWQLISTISYGKTKTYGELARSLGGISLARAVGGACNANPLALYIPCHRVVGKNGPGGFAGGSGIKCKLLELEACS